MSSSVPPGGGRIRGRRRALLSGLATAVAAGLAATMPASPAPAAQETAPVVSDVTMVQANIKSDLSVEKFQADVRKVLAQTPDFITYNEVPERMDWVIAPEGYDLQRSHDDRYTKATAVAWREDRWTAIAQGTYRISNYREKPPGRNIMIGLRYANWATLQSDDGRRVSVVAVHVAPIDRNMPDLLPRSVRRIAGLVEQLAPAGPVLVGGDFNVHYKSGRYPRELLDAAQMVPTYDSLASFFPTGDHGGYTIDYVFNRGAGKLAAEQHRAVELNSDHDAVVAGLSWLVDAPAETQRVVSDPGGDEDAQRRALDTLVADVAATERGSELDVVTSELHLRGVFRQLKAAAERGVHVRLTTRSETLTRQERRLTRALAATGGSGSYVRQCVDACLQAWRDSGMARSFMLLRDADGRARLRVDVNRNLDEAVVERRTRVVHRTGEHGLDAGEEMLASLP